MKYIFLINLSISIFIIQAGIYIINSDNIYIWTGTVLINILIILYYLKKSTPITILFIFFVPYSYIAKYYFFDNIPISAHNAYQTHEILNINLIFLSLFFISIIASLGKINDLTIAERKYPGALKSRLFFMIFLLASIISMIFGQTGDTILISGYGLGDAQKSTLYEYFILFFILMVLTTDPTSLFQKRLIIVIFISYIAKSLLFGGRIEVLMILLSYAYLYKNFLWDKKLITLLCILVGLFAMDLYGKIRSDVGLIYSDNFIENYFFSENKVYSISNQFGDVLQSSARIVGLTEDGLITTNHRLLSLILVIFGFLPTSMLPEYYSLASYQQQVTRSGGGGLISAFSYTWLSYLGPIVFGYFIGTILRNFYKTDNIIIGIYSIIILVMFPRWFAYYPVTLFKIAVLGVIFALSIIFYKNIFNKKHYKKT